MMLQRRIFAGPAHRALASCRCSSGAVIRSYATAQASPGRSPVAAQGGKTSDSAAAKDTTKINQTNIILRTYKPRTPGTRHLKRPINDHLWRGRPHLPLTLPKKGLGKGGRNHHGRVTVRHRGGGAKRRLRTVDFDRWKPGPHLVERIEYDPNRSAHIALLTEEATGDKTYIIAATGMRAGDVIQSYRSGIPQDLLDSMGGVLDPGVLAAKTAHRGNCLPLHLIPVNMPIYNVGSHPKRGAVFCRSAGTHAVIDSKEEETRNGIKVVTGKYINVRMQSGEIRKCSKDACGTIGVASNPHHQYRQLGKAGRSRLLNIRPTVRGVAMNKGQLSPSSLLCTKLRRWTIRRLKAAQWTTPTVEVVAKGGYKTRRKNNPNRWVVVARVRNHGQRRDRKGKQAK